MLDDKVLVTQFSIKMNHLPVLRKMSAKAICFQEVASIILTAVSNHLWAFKAFGCWKTTGWHDKDSSNPKLQDCCLGLQFHGDFITFPFKEITSKAESGAFPACISPYYVRSTEDSQSELVMPLEFWDGGTEALDLSWQYATAHPPLL